MKLSMLPTDIYHIFTKHKGRIVGILLILLFLYGQNSILLAASPQQRYKNSQIVELAHQADSLAHIRAYDSALTILTTMLKNADRIELDNDTLVTWWYRNGMYLYQLAQYADAEQTWLKVLALSDSLLRPNNVIAAETRAALGGLYRTVNRFDDAEAQYKIALSMLTKLYGENHPTIAKTLSGYAILLIDMGHLSEAEYHLTHALAMDESLLGENHPDLVRLLNNLAMLYWIRGDLEKAEPLYKRALQILKDSYGDEHPHLASVLNNLALLYNQQGRIDEIIPLLRWSVRIAKKLQGPTHPKVALYLYNLAAAYHQEKNYDSAVEMYQQAITIKEQAFGRNHPDVSYGLRGLADVYSDLHDYQQAESLYLQALTIDTSSLGTTHIFVASDYEQLSSFYAITGKNALSREMAYRALQIRRQNFINNYRALSEQEALTFSRFMRHSADIYYTTLMKNDTQDKQILDEAGTVVLQTKGQVSDGMFTRQQEIIRETDTTLIRKAQSLKEAQKKLAHLFISGVNNAEITTYRLELDSVSSLVDSLEKDLILNSNSFRIQKEQQAISTNSIAKPLAGKAILVEYVKYQRIDFRTSEETAQYLVLVLDTSGVRTIQNLGPADIVDTLISHLQQSYQTIAMHWPHISNSTVTEIAQMNKRLYQLVWAPIERYVTGASILLIAPDGALNLVSFATLQDTTNNYLIEQYPLQYLSTGRDLLRLQEPSPPASGMLALGDPDFNADNFSSSLSSQPSEPNVKQDIRVDCNWLRNGHIPSLPYTRREAKAVVKSWTSATNQQSTLLLGKTASEEMFKQAAPGKLVIHLATHGFFNLDCAYEDSGESTQSVNPLLLSGLLLSGANQQRYSANQHEAEDGVLTAYEVTEIPLSGTRWVVLSACESGLGKITAGEGVYGLRRAFQMAGARTVISTLWSIPDKQTAHIMKKLYTSNNRNIAITLREIMLNQIKKNNQQRLPDLPFTWGAFIALGDWQYGW